MGRLLVPRSGLRPVARTAVLLGLAGFTVGVYGVVVLGGGLLVGRGDRPALALSVLATAAVALGVEPVRQRLEAAARRRAGAGASPYEVLRSFSDDVTGATTAGDVPGRIARVLSEGVDADWTQVWLSVGDQLVLAATWPADALADPAAPAGQRPAPGASDRRELTVRHGGRVYGVLRLQLRPGTAMTSVEERLVEGLASQAGPVLRLVGLQAELADRRVLLQGRADELRRSRARLVEAQDSARRQLERDIHDGAQQHLVALAVNLRLAQTVAARSPERAAVLLAEQAEAARAASSTVAELSRGIYPALLTSAGLVPALREVLGSAPFAVDVRTGADHTDVEQPPAVQAALYFVVLEAVQNATKHARAGRVGVRLSLAADRAEAVVEDDGVGFDVLLHPASAAGTGLSNLRDRLDAVGGRLTVTSSPGHGTTVTAVVPTAAQDALPHPRQGV